MRFESSRVLPCLTSTPCESTFGNLPDPRCADAAFRSANPQICGGGDDGGDPAGTCADPNYRATHLSECGDDERCADPAFAAANPALCLGNPVLLLKPESATREIGKSVQFKTFLLINGAESELTSGIVYRSDATNVAVIGSSSGNATGLAMGVTSISVTYGDLTAKAQLEIVNMGDCDARSNYFAFVVDISKSSKAAFSGLAANRLAMAKRIANSFIDSTNLHKDYIGVVSFDTGTTLVDFTNDDALAHGAVNALASSNNKTSISAGLTRASEALSLITTASNRHIVLFTDGENNEGIDPIALAQSLKDSGVTVWVIGLRATFTPFRLLDLIATGGFFVNALPSNETSVIAWVNGLKGYICSGNCDPTGDVVVGVPALNFEAFINWDVTAGSVDLIGKNTGGPEDFNLLPENGLYVDLCGSTESDVLGTLRTKREFTFVDQKEYLLTVRLAGNNREERVGDQVAIIVGRIGATMISETVTVPWNQGFAEYAYGFIAATADGNTGLGKIVIGQVVNSGTQQFGCLLDCVTLKNVTDDTVMFTDCFDADNPTYIPPCDGGTDYGLTGYGCDTGCLESPIPAQMPDPNPLPDTEKAVVNPPTIYSSEKSCTVDCTEGTGSATETAGAVSDVSQADADSRALAQACANAQAALVCDGGTTPGLLVNYNFTPNLVSAMSGAAVFGMFGDYWNTSFIGGTVKDANGLVVPITLSFGFPGLTGGFSIGLAESFSTDLMRHHAYATADTYFLISGLPAGTYSLLLYGHGDGAEKNANFIIEKGTFDVNGVASGATTNIGSGSTVNGEVSYSGFTSGDEFVRFNGLAIGAAGQIRITVKVDSDTNWFFNGWQIKRTA